MEMTGNVEHKARGRNRQICTENSEEKRERNGRRTRLQQRSRQVVAADSELSQVSGLQESWWEGACQHVVLQIQPLQRHNV